MWKLVAIMVVVTAGCRTSRSSSGTLDDAAADVQPAAGGLRDVVVVGNSVDGSVTFIDQQSLALLGTINVIPDLNDRMNEINASPSRLAAFTLVKHEEVVKHFEPADGLRYVDDAVLSPDGTKLYVSRGNLGDVVAIDLSQPGYPIIWRHEAALHKADHAALSPDGKTLVVSASLALKAEALDTATGNVVGWFPTGIVPHQNDYSKDGQHIYNGSIGNLSLPYALRLTKGPIALTVVDASTYQVLKVIPFELGIRPTVITDDETTMYADLSYLNGLIKYDLVNGQTVAKADEPLSDFANANYPTKDDFPHNSAHHGLSLSGDGQHLCDCGTIDNTVSIVSADDLSVEATLPVGLMPYWATTSKDGNRCFVSISGDNQLAVVDFTTKTVTATVQVGKYPQRNRIGQLAESVIAQLGSSQPSR